MNATDLAKQYKADLEYNAANPMFSDKDDEMLGERKDGYYSKIDDVNGRKFLCHTFDNGHCYYMNPNTKKIMQFTELRPDLFLHKYIETYVSNFVQANALSNVANATFTVQFEEVILANADVHFLQIEIDRDENALLVESIFLANADVEMKLLAGIYRLCKFCAFPMFVGNTSDSLAEMLENAGAVKDEDDIFEINETTQLS